MKRSLTLLAVLLSFTAVTQNSDTVSTQVDAPEITEPWSFATAKKYVKFTPFDIISYTPTVGVDLEVKGPKDINLQGGVAILPSFLQYAGSAAFSGYESVWGYRLRTEARLYMPIKKRQYFAIGFSFRHMVIKEEVAFGKEPTVGEFGQVDFAYFENIDMIYHRFNRHFDLKYGFQKVTDVNNLVFDFYMGISLRGTSVISNTETPENSEQPQQRGLWTLIDGHSFKYPVPMFGVKIGFTK